MTDEELIERIKENPSKGFEKLMELYSGLVFRIVSATLVPLGTKEDAQECASDVFVLMSLDSFAQRAKQTTTRYAGAH